MIRVVLDTNILISALLQPQGLPARTVVLVLTGTTAPLCVSGDVYAEYEEVIRRPKFSRSKMIIDHALRAIRQNGSWATKGCMPALIPMTTFSWSAPRPHTPTNLVTGNLKDFPVKWADTEIVTARQFRVHDMTPSPTAIPSTGRPSCHILMGQPSGGGQP